jgi:hypothetical protein
MSYINVTFQLELVEALQSSFLHLKGYEMISLLFHKLAETCDVTIHKNICFRICHIHHRRNDKKYHRSSAQQYDYAGFSAWCLLVIQHAPNI